MSSSAADLPYAETLQWRRSDVTDHPPLTGRRRTIHRACPLAIAAFAILAVLGYLLPAHQLNGTGSFHSNFEDGGALSLVVLAVVAAVALALRGRRFGTGMIAGAVAMLGAALALGPVLVTHLVVHVEHTTGQHLFNGAIVATFVSGAILAIGEPLLYRAAR